MDVQDKQSTGDIIYLIIGDSMCVVADEILCLNTCDIIRVVSGDTCWLNAGANECVGTGDAICLDIRDAMCVGTYISVLKYLYHNVADIGEKSA